MPTLTYTINNAKHGAIVNGRLLIGRRLPTGLSLNDPGVSRLHAWIDAASIDAASIDAAPTNDAGWIITDAGSKSGTLINDRKIARQLLHDGDQIRIGGTTFTFHTTDQLPRGVQPADTSASPDNGKSAGILFQSACGAPLWVSVDLAGKRGMCRHCRKPVTVPAPQVAGPAQPRLMPGKSKRQAKCAVCHSVIAPGEEITQCTDCAMTFHAECWQENLGCSSYGCPQVDALKPREEPAAETESPESQVESAADAPVEPAVESTVHPWDAVLLAASLLSWVVGALTFGGVAAIVAIGSLILLIRGKQRRPVFLILAIVLSLIGIVEGLAVSDFWYFNGQHLPNVFMRR
jgi:hypothetical protein